MALPNMKMGGAQAKFEKITELETIIKVILKENLESLEKKTIEEKLARQFPGLEVKDVISIPSDPRPKGYSNFLQFILKKGSVAVRISINEIDYSRPPPGRGVQVLREWKREKDWQSNKKIFRQKYSEITKDNNPKKIAKWIFRCIRFLFTMSEKYDEAAIEKLGWSPPEYSFGSAQYV